MTLADPPSAVHNPPPFARRDAVGRCRYRLKTGFHPTLHVGVARMTSQPRSLRIGVHRLKLPPPEPRLPEHHELFGFFTQMKCGVIRAWRDFCYAPGTGRRWPPKPGESSDAGLKPRLRASQHLHVRTRRRHRSSRITGELCHHVGPCRDTSSQARPVSSAAN
jgi:hypothetical protein